MHRHGYKGRKFGREKDEREALIKSLADSLILNESIQTTKAKAKEVKPYVEKLITKAKKGDIHNRRLVLAKLMTTEANNKLFNEIAPKLKNRQSGYLRIEVTENRRGDNAPMAKISFVDDLNTPVKVEKTEKPDVKKSETAKAKKPTAKKEVKK